MRMVRSLSVSAALLLVFEMGTVGALAANVDVDIELVLAGDVSHSMGDHKLRVQRDGFATAFRHAELMWAIRSGALGRIAVTYVEWAGPMEQWVIVPWTIVANRKDADAFADGLATAPIVKGSHTSMSNGLLFAADQFKKSGAQAIRKTIDVSGDGPNNAGAPIGSVRDFILGQGITINGLSFGTPSNDEQGPFSYMFQRDDFNLDTYYEGCVIGGAGAFAMTANDPSRFVAAIRRKLALEIASVPVHVIPVAFVDLSRPRADCLIGDGAAAK